MFANGHDINLLPLYNRCTSVGHSHGTVACLSFVILIMLFDEYVPLTYKMFYDQAQAIHASLCHSLFKKTSNLTYLPLTPHQWFIFQIFDVMSLASILRGI